MKNYKIVMISLAMLIVTGCSSMTPQYQPDFTLVNKLKNMDIPSMKSGDFSEKDDSVNRITIRGGSMISPYGDSYAQYLKNALEEELKQSDLWDQSSDIMISGILIKNEHDGSGIRIGESDISAKFTVMKSGNEIYSKTHTIHHEWASSFMGAIAIPRAQNNYPIAIQKLIRSLLTDRELLSILN